MHSGIFKPREPKPALLFDCSAANAIWHHPSGRNARVTAHLSCGDVGECRVELLDNLGRYVGQNIHVPELVLELLVEGGVQALQRDAGISAYFSFKF